MLHLENRKGAKPCGLAPLVECMLSSGLMYFCFPESVQVAELVNGYRFVVADGEDRLSLLLWLEIMDLASVPGLQIDEYNVVLNHHRVWC